MEIYSTSEKKTLDVMKAVNIALLVFVVILAFILISMSFLWTPMTVSGPSMNDTLHDEDKFILQTCWYKPKYGDIIVFEKVEEEKNVIKRVIGLPGDYIRFDEENKVWLRNGEVLKEDYVSSGYSISYFSGTPVAIKNAICSEQGYFVAEDRIFVLGDNRANSSDSHVYGAISMSQIKGKYLFTYHKNKRRLY